MGSRDGAIERQGQQQLLHAAAERTLQGSGDANETFLGTYRMHAIDFACFCRRCSGNAAYGNLTSR